MSTRRIIGISAFGVLFIAIVIGLMMMTSFSRRDIGLVPLPTATETPGNSPGRPETDRLDRVEVNSSTVQAVIATLARPEAYSRSITVESLWDGGQAIYTILVSVRDGLTSLRIIPPVGTEKRIIISHDTQYIWYRGEKTPFIGKTGSAGDETRNADEWQMLATYEDILKINKDEITDAEYVQYGGEDCIYIEHLSPLLNYTMKYYISVGLGLVTGAEEYDNTGALIYKMTADECLVGVADLSQFILPDGTELITN